VRHDLVMPIRWGQNSDLGTSVPFPGFGSDIDECEDYGDPVCGTWRCENSPGSYRCVLGCQPGFYMAPTGDCIGEWGLRGGRAEDIWFSLYWARNDFLLRTLFV
jgi:hypothetical protein